MQDEHIGQARILQELKKITAYVKIIADKATIRTKEASSGHTPSTSTADAEVLLGDALRALDG